MKWIRAELSGVDCGLLQRLDFVLFALPGEFGASKSGDVESLREFATM
jgi:hypothetical protein